MAGRPRIVEEEDILLCMLEYLGTSHNPWVREVDVAKQLVEKFGKEKGLKLTSARRYVTDMVLGPASKRVDSGRTRNPETGQEYPVVRLKSRAQK